MKDFHFTADIVFKAENIDDAMRKIGKHLIEYDQDTGAIFLGKVKCEPVQHE